MKQSYMIKLFVLYLTAISVYSKKWEYNLSHDHLIAKGIPQTTHVLTHIGVTILS